MDKIFFSLGFFHFYQFGTVIAIGAFCSLIISLLYSRLRKEPLYVALEAFIFAVPCAIICARIFFVFTNLGAFAANPWEALFFWHGGFSPEGALIGALGIIYVYMSRTNRDFWDWMDTFTPGIAIGQFIGQIAYFVNQANFGYPVKYGWGIYIDFALRPDGYKQFDFFEPICLYQAGWALLLFAIFVLLSWFNRKRRWSSGVIFLLYMVIYNVGNIIMEGMTLTTNVFELKIAQLFAVMLGLVALSLLVRRIYHTSYKYIGTNFYKK